MALREALEEHREARKRYFGGARPAFLQYTICTRTPMEIIGEIHMLEQPREARRANLPAHLSHSLTVR